MAHEIYTKIYDATDPRLGRHVKHDSRSLEYLYPEAERASLASIKHQVHIPTLDQGQLGSCTGNAATHNIGAGYFWDNKLIQGHLSPSDAGADEKFAVELYSAATQIDGYPGQYPPTDTGSDGLSVAKALKNSGLISGYQHAITLDAVLSALAKQPVIIGIEWFTDMFNPAPDGALSITGNLAGGHEVCLDELDMENQRVWIHNSWGSSWGLEGRAFLSFDDLNTLLINNGDCTIFTPITVPAPVPVPPTPPAPPTPTPTPDDPKATFVTAAQEWLSHHHSAHVNRVFVDAVRAYLATL